MTQLDEVQEMLFQDWYSAWANVTGINPDPDDPRHMYDYRAAYLDKAKPTLALGDDNRFHWPSQYKVEGHPNEFVNNDVVSTRRGGGVRK